MDSTDKPDQEEAGGLPSVRPHVAGIDIGSVEHWVCAPAVGGQGREVRVFGATTPELDKLAGHEVLERREFEVVLVNTRELARVPGRSKTDRRDCEWIQRLHSCGLLRGAFRPPQQICRLRTLVRDKANLVAERVDWVRRMQKSLDQMSVRVHRAVADVDALPSDHAWITKVQAVRHELLSDSGARTTCASEAGLGAAQATTGGKLGVPRRTRMGKFG